VTDNIGAVHGIPSILLGFDGNFNHTVPAVLKEGIGFVDALECIGMGNERGSVDLPCRNQLQCFGTVAAIHAAGFEGEIFAIHLRQGQRLGTVVQGHHRHDGIGAGALSGHAESLIAAGHLQHHICTPVVTVCLHQIGHLLGTDRQNFRIVVTDEL